jgi:hypothetical protein
MTDLSHVDEELRQGVAMWEAGQHLEAQEEFEQLWRTEVGPRRHFLRGLVHAAMGFHYLTMGDTVSACAKLGSAGSLLKEFPGDFLGLNIDGLREGIATARTVLEAARGDMPSDPPRIPIPCLTRVSSGAAVRKMEP